MGLLTVINLLFGVGFILAAQEWTEVTNVPTLPKDLGPGLLRLHIYGHKLLYLNYSSLENYPKLQKLSLDTCGLEYIAEGTFDSTPHLTDLYLIHLPLKALPSTLGAAQLSLNWVKLWAVIGTPIYELTNDNYFRNFSKLTYLGLGENVIKNHNTSILPSHLTYLNAVQSVMTSLPNLSNAVPILNHIRCSSNLTRTIPPGNLAGLEMINTFRIQHNQLEELSDIGFMLEVRELSIDNNNLESLPDLYHLPLEILRLTGNPWVCDQALCWVRMWPWAKPLPVLCEPVCAKPAGLQAIRLMSVKATLLHRYNGNVESTQLNPQKSGCFCLQKTHYERSWIWIVWRWDGLNIDIYLFSNSILDSLLWF